MWILDNSVIIKWFFLNEPYRDKALEVREAVALKSNQFAIPTLCYVEFVHVVCRKSQNNLDFVSHCVDQIVRLGIRSFPETTSIIHEAARLACTGFSGYDATYLALAKDLNGIWLTADQKAVKQDNQKHSIWLGDWTLDILQIK